MELDENALLVLRKRYLVKDEAGNPIETPSDLFRRVASAVAAAEGGRRNGRQEEIEEAFYGMMANLEFLPNSPTLMNAGRPSGQLAACFVLPVEDSLDSIFDGVKLTAKIHQTGGGTGFSFSRLRPNGDMVRSMMGVASGPVSFIRVFNCATDVMKQGGTRRGANMGILRIDHPDIEEFVSVKKDPAELTNFNLSVAVTDDFMRAYREDRDFSLINPRTGKEARRVPARTLLRLIAESRSRLRRPGRDLYRYGERGQPDPAHRRDRGHEPVRGAASSPLRILLPRVDRPLEIGKKRRDRLGQAKGADPPGRPVPRRCDRRKRLSLSGDHGDHEGKPEDRPRRHGLRPPPYPAGASL